MGEAAVVPLNAALPFDPRTIEVVSFDCYGTLIDWERGILEALGGWLEGQGRAMEPGALLAWYARNEAELERGPYRPYRQILREIGERLARSHGLPAGAQAGQLLVRALPRWRPFPDSAAALRALARRFKLAVLSNVDDDLFSATAAELGIRFDWIVTAEQVRAYKPSAAFFRAALERIRVPQSHWLHAAQSAYHDLRPARAHGLWTAHVARRGGPGATPHAPAAAHLRVPDLATLAAVLCR